MCTSVYSVNCEVKFRFTSSANIQSKPDPAKNSDNTHISAPCIKLASWIQIRNYIVKGPDPVPDPDLDPYYFSKI
jgi:hypothetical protein